MTAAFIAPAEVPETASMSSQGSSRKRSSTPQVKAPCEPPPCRARSTSTGARAPGFEPDGAFGISLPSTLHQGLPSGLPSGLLAHGDQLGTVHSVPSVVPYPPCPAHYARCATPAAVPVSARCRVGVRSARADKVIAAMATGRTLRIRITPASALLRAGIDLTEETEQPVLGTLGQAFRIGA